MELRALGLYPDQMNIYADRGNIIFLRRRCEWRGIGFVYGAVRLYYRADRRSALTLYLFSLAYLALLFASMVIDRHV